MLLSGVASTLKSVAQKGAEKLIGNPIKQAISEGVKSISDVAASVVESLGKAVITDYALSGAQNAFSTGCDKTLYWTKNKFIARNPLVLNT
jgi:hypothetical protein